MARKTIAVAAVADVIGKFEELAEAKRNVVWLLDHENGLVDFHGLAYWAGIVERLRAEVKASL